MIYQIIIISVKLGFLFFSEIKCLNKFKAKKENNNNLSKLPLFIRLTGILILLLFIFRYPNWNIQAEKKSSKLKYKSYSHYLFIFYNHVTCFLQLSCNQKVRWEVEKKVWSNQQHDPYSNCFYNWVIIIPLQLHSTCNFLFGQNS